MRLILVHFAFTALGFAGLLAAMLATYLWMGQSESMRSEFSPSACARDNGIWDHAIEICRHEQR